MRIVDAFVPAGLGGYYFDDYAAIKNGVKSDGIFLLGNPVTKWHKKVRQPGESMSIVLILENGCLASGDCVAIQYSGIVGRDPILLSQIYKPIVEKIVLPFLIGKDLHNFCQIVSDLDNLTDEQGIKLHSGIRYGASQAVLEAVGLASGRIAAEVIRDEFNTIPRTTSLDIIAQSGEERYIMADKMIMKKVPSIPHGLFNKISDVGKDGTALLEYTNWLRERVQKYGSSDYKPTFHFDVYGIIGEVFNNDVEKVAKYLGELANSSYPYPLRIEHPIDLQKRDSTIEAMSKLVTEIEKMNIPVEICADDWCNTYEDIKDFVDAGAAHMIQIKAPDLGSIHHSVQAVMYCKNNGVKAFLGGTCNETDISSRITVQVAIASNADLIYSKPGTAVDEGYMIVFNEMQRTLAILNRRRKNNN